MRRRGATHASKRAREPTEPTKCYGDARKRLCELLKGFALVEVHEVNLVSASSTKPEFFHGSAVTLSNSKYSKERQERVFFDKGGRLRYNNTFDIGPCKLIDAAWGRDHRSAVPQIGDILIGVLEDNPRVPARGGANRMTKVLKGWSRHGKIILELARINEFGTVHGEYELRDLLKQRECELGEQFVSSQTVGNLQELGRVNKRSSADDFWMLARIILWGNIRPLVVLHSTQQFIKCFVDPTESELKASAELKLSVSAYDFVSQLSFRLEDASILKDFNESFIDSEVARTAERLIQGALHSFTASSPYQSTTPLYGSPSRTKSSPPYVPSSSPMYTRKSPQSKTPVYAPRSPGYAPTSPGYAPRSPEPYGYAPRSPEPKSPIYAPRSPLPQSTDYAPKSPGYAPKSPGYAPRSPLLTSPPPKSPVFTSAPETPMSSQQALPKKRKSRFAFMEPEKSLISYEDI